MALYLYDATGSPSNHLIPSFPVRRFANDQVPGGRQICHWTKFSSGEGFGAGAKYGLLYLSKAHNWLILPLRTARNQHGRPALGFRI